MLTTRRSVPLLAIAVLLSFALIGVGVACGGDGDNGGDGGGASPTPAGDGGERTFDINIGDRFFDITAFTVSPGETITFNLTNGGALTHSMHVAGADNIYNTGDDVESDPDIIQPGDSAVLLWQAPGDAGEYQFRCDFHPIEMVGTVTVE